MALLTLNLPPLLVLGCMGWPGCLQYLSGSSGPWFRLPTLYPRDLNDTATPHHHQPQLIHDHTSQLPPPLPLPFSICCMPPPPFIPSLLYL